MHREHNMETNDGNFFFLFRASPAAYGGAQARGSIGAAAVGLRHNHSNMGFELHLQPPLQFTPDP